MTTAVGILTFFVILAVLILIHELGHFSTAKLLGVRVEEFGLGFPPRIKSWKRGGTVYSLNALPIGGFVKMLGENGDHLEPDSFGAQAPWRRLVILAAGPAMNLLLAIAVFFFVFFVTGSPKFITRVTQVAARSPAAAAGIRPGDRIIGVDGVRVAYYEDLRAATRGRLGEHVALRITRGRDVFVTTLVPRRHPPRDQGAMGIQTNETALVTYSASRSAQLAVAALRDFVVGIPTIIQSVSRHGGSQLAGPIGIAHATTDVVRQEPRTGVGSLLEFVAFLSINLGILNLLPVPALDGGRIVFVLISWARRRNLDPELETMIHLTGMAALIMLIVLISYHDLVKWFSGGSF